MNDDKEKINPLDELKDFAQEFKNSGKEILQGLSKKVNKGGVKKQEHQEKNVDEALMTIASVALSTGKIAELVGEVLKKMGMKFGASESSSINKISNYLITQGNAYTNLIESVISKILSLTPGVSQLYKTLDDKQKKVLSKTVLSVILIFMMYKAGGEIWSYFKKGDNILASLKAALTGVKFSEIQHNIPHIMASILPVAFVKGQGHEEKPKEEVQPEQKPTQEKTSESLLNKNGKLVNESIVKYLR